jgi:type II restriction enzyme
MRFVSPQEIKQMLENDGIYNQTGNITININGLSVILHQNDIIGNALQEWIYNYLRVNEIYYRPPVGQSFPDFYLSELEDRNLCEMKSFNYESGPAFDVADFRSYIRSLPTNPYRLDSDYIMFGYTNDITGNIRIKEIWVKKVWEITGLSVDGLLSAQRKNNRLVNIRPFTFYSNRARTRPFNTLEEYIRTLYQEHRNDIQSPREARQWLNSVIDAYENYSGIRLNVTAT